MQVTNVSRADNKMNLESFLINKNYEPLKPKRRSQFWESLFPNHHENQWFILKDTPDYSNELLILLKTPLHATGHSGISHGGLVATLFDEPLCYAAYPVLPHHTGVTASLSISYMKPTKAGSWVMLRARAVGTQGSRKASVNAQIYPIDVDMQSFPWEASEPLASAVQVVVEPKWYADLDHR